MRKNLPKGKINKIRINRFDVVIKSSFCPVYDFVIEMCDFIIAYEGEIPGAAPEQCGNYSEQNMNMAKYYIKKYKKELEENKRFIYPN